MNVTIRDVAAKAQVSNATVSLVLNGRPCRVSEATRQRVKDAARELGFRSAALKQMAGILLPDISNLFFPALGRPFCWRPRSRGTMPS